MLLGATFSLTSLITGTLFKATLLFLVVILEYVYMMYRELYNNAKYTKTRYERGAFTRQLPS